MSEEKLKDKEKMWVRFPNESFSDEVFGYWCGGYVVIKREDYDRLTQKTKP